MRKILLLPTLIVGAFLLGNTASGSAVQAATVATTGLNALAPFSEASKAGVTEVGKHRRKYRRNRGYHRHGRYSKRYHRRHYSRSNRYSHRKYRRNRNRDVIIGSALGLGLLAAPSYGYYRHSGGRCSHWARQCANNWGHGNSNYYGCLRYHRC